ncbi:MAG: Verru_Chthon cassette protein A [Verrucomicrobiota bacterium]
MKVFYPKTLPTHRSSKQGVALVLSLVGLVLISLIVVAILSSVNYSVTSTQYYVNTADARQMANSAVDVVIAQIEAATSNANETWISQPGLIRTFNSGGAVASYKLYSSDELFVTGNFDPTSPSSSNDPVPNEILSPTSSNQILDFLSNNSSRWTDMNRPVVTRQYDTSGGSWRGTAHYPIINPGAIETGSGNPLNGEASTGVNGFSVENNFLDGNPATLQAVTDFSIPSNTVPQIPMPVKWLYVLQDGQVVLAQDSSGTNEASIPNATNSNPIVARIAFWTDDESCKININTAAGDEWTPQIVTDASGKNVEAPGTFVDFPRGLSIYERDYMAAHQPMANEFQRYGGHPATVHLSAVFPSLTRSQIADITPKVTNQNSQSPPQITGSEGGRKITAINEASGSLSASFANQGPVSIDSTEGLYSSIDELVFKGDLVAGKREETLSTVITPQRLEQSRFFLTANSRSPETNVFNRPRITIWPITIGKETAYDQVFKFCSTIGGKEFYFQRSNPISPTFDYSSIPRNQQLYQYLQDLTNTSFPSVSGGAGSFNAKYPQDRNQILTSIFDYIRVTNPLDTNGLSPGDPFTNTYTTPPSSPYSETFGAMRLQAGSGLVAPIRIGTTQGFGRFPIITEATLVFLAGNETWTPNPPTDLSIAPWEAHDPSIRVDETTIDVALLFETHTLGQGSPVFIPDVIVDIQLLSSMSLSSGATTHNLNLRQRGGGLALDSSASSLHGSVERSGVGGRDAITNWFTHGRNDINNFFTAGIGPSTSTQYPFGATGLSFTSPAPELIFSGGTIDVTVSDSSGNTIHDYRFNFPSGQIPLPLAIHEDLDGAKPEDSPGVKTLTSRIGMQDVHIPTRFGLRGDVWRSIEVVEGGGDYRIYAPKIPLNASGTFNDYTRAHYMYAETYDYQTNTGSNSDGTTSGHEPFISADPMIRYAHSFRSQTNQLLHMDNNASSIGTWRALHNDQHNLSFTPPVNGLSYHENSFVIPRTATIYAFNNFDPNRTGAVRNNGDLGDFSDATQLLPAGPWVSLPDAGDSNWSGLKPPFFEVSASADVMPVASLFSPNRMVPSPIIFGSLPTGVFSRDPWQTLLFCPNPASISDHSQPGGQHPGWNNPKDHLILDLFTMPVVEPYPISEPLSTAGKINMNYQIAPFTYITRNTGLQAVLKATRVTALHDNHSLQYLTKGGNSNRLNYGSNDSAIHSIDLGNAMLRHPINLSETLSQFEARFGNNQPFLSSSEICELFLIPDAPSSRESTISSDPTAANIETWWEDFKTTGDNTREHPYSQIYSLLTTRSNTYRVHVKVQTLKKATTTPATSFVEDTDQVTGEFRGSYLIERFIDPNDPQLSNGTINPDTDSLNDAYKFRIISFERFAP